MKDLAAKQKSENTYSYTDSKYPTVTLHIQVPAGLDGSSQKRAHSLADQLAKEIFAKQSQQFPSEINLKISIEALKIDSSDKHAAEGNSKEWMAAQCRSILSKISFPTASATQRKSSEAAKELVSAPKISEIYSDDLNELMMQVGHIHGDLFIQATQLEGYEQLKMMKLSLKILEKQLVSLRKLPQDTQTAETIKEITLLMTRITNGLKTQEPVDIPGKVASIQKMIKDLKPSEGILLPGGWIAIPQGHAMCYEIIKQKDNRFTMRIINTGAGISNHTKIDILELDNPGRQSKMATKFFPYLEFIDISPEKMISGDFWKAALEMQMHKTVPSINPDANTRTQYDDTDLYTKLFPTLGGTKVIPSKTHPERFILAQSSGICSWSSIRAYMQTHLSAKAFARLEYEYKMESLLQLYHALNSSAKLAANEKGRLLLFKSSQYMANSLQENYEKHVISIEEYKKSNASLQQIQDDIAESIKLLNEKFNKEAPKIAFPPATNIFFPNPHTVYAPIDLTVSEVQKKNCQVIFNKNWTPTALTIDKDLAGFLKIYSENLDTFPENVCLCTRELLLKLPKSTDAFWKEIPTEKIDICVESISKLCELLMRGSQMTFRSTDDLTGASFLAGIYKSQTIIHALIKRIPELLGMGADKWNINTFDLSAFSTPRKFNLEVANAIQDLQTYANNSEQTFLGCLSKGQRADKNFSGLPKNDYQFAYFYYLRNKMKFDATLGADYNKIIGQSKEAHSLDQDLCKATYALTDLSGKFFPPSYSAMRRLQFQIDHFLTSTQIPTNTHGLKFRLTDNLFYLDHDNTTEIPKKNCSNDYSRNYSLLTRFSNKLPNDKEVVYFCHNNPQLKQICQICEVPDLDGLITVPFEIQIIKLLDYFKVHTDSLNNHDLQCFFKQVLYRENDLNTVLQKNPELANRLVIFIQNGYSVLKERKNISGATFMIYLAQMMQETLSSFPKPSPIDINSALVSLNSIGVDAAKPQSNVQNLTSLLKDCKTLAEKSIVHRQLLYQYSFDLNHPKIASNLLPDIIASMAFLRSFPVPEGFTNSHVQDQVDRLRMVYLPPYLEQINKDSMLLTAIAQKASQLLGFKEAQTIEWNKIKWSSIPPVHKGCGTNGTLEISLDLSNFTVLAAGEGLGPLPSTILTNPGFLRAFPSMEHQSVKIKQLNLYEFTDEKGLKVRIKTLDNNTIIIQREFAQNGQWFQYLSPEVAPPFTHSTILSEERTHWMCCGADQMLLCKPNTSECTHIIKPKTGADNYFELTDIKSGLRLLFPGNPPDLDQPYKGLQNFEDTAFTHVWVHPDTNLPSCIEMPRLHLTFNLSTNLGTTYATCAEITGYRIAEKQHVPFLGTFKNYLVLQNGKGEIKVIIPRKKAVVTERGGLTSQLTLANQFPAETSKFPPYYEYTINSKSGELEATKEGGNLYLAYLLTGQRRYAEVQTYLREKSAKLKKYSNREIQILAWINELVFDTQDNDPKACIAYLTATALFAKNQILGKKYDLTPGNILLNYTSYLSNMHHLGDLLLSPEEELPILKILIKEYPGVRKLLKRFNSLLGALIGLDTTVEGNIRMNSFESESLFTKSIQSPISKDMTYESNYNPQKKYKDIYDALKKYIQNSNYKTEESNKESQALSLTLITRPNQDHSTATLTKKSKVNSTAPFHMKEKYEAARATKTGENVTAAMHFVVSNAFDPNPCNMFLAAVALQPQSFPSWDELVQLFEPHVKESQSNGLTKFQDIEDSPILNDFIPKSDRISDELIKLFTISDGIYSNQFPSMKSINEPDQKIAMEVLQKSHIEAKTKAAAATPLPPSAAPSDTLFLPNSFNAEGVSKKRMEASQKIIKELFVASQISLNEDSTKTNSEQLTKELSQKVMASNDSMAPTALTERARKHLIDDIRIFSQQPIAPNYKLKETNLKSAYANLEKNLHLLSALRNDLNQETIRLQTQIVGLLNKSAFAENPSIAHLEVTAKYKAELLSGQKKNITINDLSLALLRHNPSELTVNNPHLSKDDLEALSLMLNSYLIRLTEENTLKRQEEALLETMAFIQPLLELPTAIDSPELNERINKAFKELSVTRAYKLDDPKMTLPYLIFEAATGLNLRPDQIENLTGLIKADNQIRQMIMGSGKSKILLPLLALTKADGKNLSLIIIPAPLLESTTEDLRSNLGKAFGKSVQILPFARDTEFTVSKLQDIYDHLNEIIRNRQCLIMTPKSVACLGLKLNEALELFTTEPNNPDLREKIQLLQKILSTFKNHGKAILDEADIILNSRLEVNFTAGTPISLTKERRETVRSIYQQLINPGFHKEIGFNPIEEFNLSTDAYHKQFKPVLLKNILEDAEKEPQSTFGKYLKTLSSSNKATIINYLEGLDSLDIEHLIEKSPLRDTLALLKEELNTLLPLTLSKQYCVHYGPSQMKTTANQPISSVAIPYKGNNSPDETSQFQSPDILMNYTMQTLMRTGIPISDVKRVVENLRNQANYEMALKGSRDPISTTAYKEFQELCGKELSHIKFLSTEYSEIEQIAERINKMRTTTPAIFLNYVSTYVFPQIKLHPRQMTSDAINLVSMFKSVNGFTGTPWNGITYHEAIVGHVVTAAGTDGKTAVLLNNQIQTAKDGIRQVSQKMFPDIIADLVRKDDDAIIDTGALFAGHSHEKVASGILAVLQTKGSTKKGVIFYKNNKAMVLELTKTSNKPRLIPLKACTFGPKELFTYYDQSHTTGADIPQHLMAKATLTIGKDIMERDLLQGAWRMRGLDKQQTVSLALSQEVSKKIVSQFMLKSFQDITFAHILNFVSQNQVEELSPQLMTSLKNKFNDMVLQQVKNKILNTTFFKKEQMNNLNNISISASLETEDATQKLIKEVQHIFVSEFNNSPYTLYGKQEKPLPTLETLQKMKNNALRKLETIPSTSDLFESTNKKAFIEKIANQMDVLIKETIGLLPELSKGTSANESTAQNEQEAQSETELTLQNQSDAMENLFNVRLTPWWRRPAVDATPQSTKEQEEGYAKTAPALLSSVTYASQSFPGVASDQVKIFNVADRLKQHFSASKFSPLFGKGLDITENADRSAKLMLGGTTQYILYVREKATGNMKLIFLEPQQDVCFFWEALDQERHDKYPLKGQPELDICLCSLDGDIVQHSKGVDPAKVDNNPFMKDFQTKGIALRAQAKLSKGELFYTSDELIAIQKIIKEHGAELVLDYFNEFILPNSSSEKQRTFKTSQIYQFLTKK